MPSKGINFSSTKSKTKSSDLSSNPRTAATRKWEHELGGLSLALHRVNKAATVARGRAIAKVKASSTYAEASKEIREKLLQEAIDDVNQKRDYAEQQWIELYAEEDDRKCKEDEIMQVDDEGEDDDEEVDVDSSTSDSVESEESDSDESEDEKDEKEDYSEAEESDEGDEDEEDVELSQEQQDALTSKLLRLRTCQSQEQQAFIARLEAQAKARGKPETPDDYVFGSGKYVRCSMTACVK